MLQVKICMYVDVRPVKHPQNISNAADFMYPTDCIQILSTDQYLVSDINLYFNRGYVWLLDARCLREKRGHNVA
jgi:hypothetical protein